MRSEDGVAPVSAIIPKSYHFSVANDFQPLLTAASAVANLSKGIESLKSLTGVESDISLVPFSPQIWMGSSPLQVSEMELHFVASNNPAINVHAPLMRLLAMSLPREGKNVNSALEKIGVSLNNPNMGMLNHPPSLKISIGSVIVWDFCYIQNISVLEEAPYTKEGYGHHGIAKINFIRRDYVYADDFANGTNTSTVAKPVISKPAAVTQKEYSSDYSPTTGEGSPLDILGGG